MSVGVQGELFGCCVQVFFIVIFIVFYLFVVKIYVTSLSFVSCSLKGECWKVILVIRLLSYVNGLLVVQPKLKLAYNVFKVKGFIIFYIS